MPMIIVAGAETFQASGMTKNGALKLTTAWADVTGWTADTVGYPGSELSGNGLRSGSANGAATVTAVIPFSLGGNAAGTQQARLLVNGNTVASSVVVTGAAGTLTASATVPLAAGDVITVQAICIPQVPTFESTVTAGAGTYVRIT